MWRRSAAKNKHGVAKMAMAMVNHEKAQNRGNGGMAKKLAKSVSNGGIRNGRHQRRRRRQRRNGGIGISGENIAADGRTAAASWRKAALSGKRAWQKRK
jgi:hypothetical protein